MARPFFDTLIGGLTVCPAATPRKPSAAAPEFVGPDQAALEAILGTGPVIELPEQADAPSAEAPSTA